MSSAQQRLLVQLKELEQITREAIERTRRGDGEEMARLNGLIASFSSQTSEASQSLAPYDVQVRGAWRAAPCAVPVDTTRLLLLTLLTRLVSATHHRRHPHPPCIRSPPWQVLLATQRELTSQVQSLRAKHAGSTKPVGFTFKKKPDTTLGSGALRRAVDDSAFTRERSSAESSKGIKPTASGVAVRRNAVVVMDAARETDVCVYDGTEGMENDTKHSSLVVEGQSDAEVRIRRLDALHQVRIRGCEDVTFKLYYTGGATAPDNDKVVVEASTGLAFGFYDEDSECAIPARTVRDFGWLKAGPSPNVRFLPPDTEHAMPEE